MNEATFALLEPAVRAACDWIVTPQREDALLSHLGCSHQLYKADGPEGLPKRVLVSVSFGVHKQGMLIVVDDEWDVLTGRVAAEVVRVVNDYKGWPLLDSWNGPPHNTGSWMFAAPVHETLHGAVKNLSDRQRGLCPAHDSYGCWGCRFGLCRMETRSTVRFAPVVACHVTRRDPYAYR